MTALPISAPFLPPLRRARRRGADILPVAAPALTAPRPASAAGGFEMSGGLNWKAIAVIVLLHAGGLAAALSTGVIRLDSQPAPLETFMVAAPDIPSPPPEQPEELEPVAVDVPPPPIMVVVPPAPVELPPAPSPIRAVTAPPPPPPQAVVAAPKAEAPARPPAPVVPPDFSAAQLNNPGPRYPFQSRRAREQGVVMLKVLVSPGGRAESLQVQQSSGFARLDEAALKTVAKWRFVPARQAGNAVAAWVLVPVTFSLGR